MGYTLIVFLVLAPVVLLLVTLFGLTLNYPLCRTAAAVHCPEPQCGRQT
jgi:hypothetical protein